MFSRAGKGQEKKGVMADGECINKMVLERERERDMKRGLGGKRVGNWWSDILQ